MRDEAKTNTQEDETDTNIGGKNELFPSLHNRLHFYRKRVSLFMWEKLRRPSLRWLKQETPAFYMADPLKPGSKAELWVNRKEG